MRYTIPPIDLHDHSCQAVMEGMLSQIIPLETIQAVLDECAAQQQRRRKLPAALVVLVCIAMNLFTRESIHAVLTRLWLAPRWLHGWELRVVANRGSISTARQRLGERPLRVLFERVCRPVADRQTPGAFAFGRRLVALDSTLEDLADTPANAACFGRSSGSHGAHAFPQLRCVYLCECGTHVIFDAELVAYACNENPPARRLLRSLEADMLLLADAGLYSFDLIVQARQRGAHVLVRVPAGVKLTPTTYLPDGSYLAHIRPSDKSECRPHEPLLVRVIEYTLDDPLRPGHAHPYRLLTTWHNCRRYRAHALVVLYHERWEIELTIDEIDTHQRLAQRPLRSRQPTGVYQEVYALLLAHFLVRTLMAQAAARQQLDPDRLSFSHALRLVNDAFPLFQVFERRCYPHLWQQLLADVADGLLPARNERSNPRVVKKRRTKFPRKRPWHTPWPQPSKPFHEAIVIL